MSSKSSKKSALGPIRTKFVFLQDEPHVVIASIFIALAVIALYWRTFDNEIVFDTAQSFGDPILIVLSLNSAMFVRISSRHKTCRTSSYDNEIIPSGHVPLLFISGIGVCTVQEMVSCAYSWESLPGLVLQTHSVRAPPASGRAS